ncbi:MAG: hypothetical protein ACXWPM_03220 [Bdellovibrionota bacterium]
MSTWIIVSWVGVAILTAVNVVIFLKLKQASEQMLQMAFPGAKDMNEALSKMQQMAAGMGGRGGQGPGRPGGRPAFPAAGGGGGKNMDAQLKAAMDMLQKMQRGGK